MKQDSSEHRRAAS